MTFPVYSTRFLWGIAETGFQEYTVPTGHKAVIRDIAVIEQGLTSAVLQARINGFPIWDFLAPDTALYQSHMEMRWVMNEGDIFALAANSGTWWFTAHGYLLQLP